MKILAALLACFTGLPAAAQGTHLGVPVKQMVTVQFTPAPNDVPGRLSAIWIYTAANELSPTYYSVPAGQTLVLTDLDVIVQSGTTSPAGGSGKLYISTTPVTGFRILAIYDTPVILNSPPVLIRGLAHMHFTAGFAFPSGSTRR